MALVSQSVKNLKGGISQQPDILRYPEQGGEQVNAWSSETEGLQKRPPLLFDKLIGDRMVLGENPYVHLINRDESEQYYVVFTGSTIKVFDLAGHEKQVHIDSGEQYMVCGNPMEDLRMITVADYTFVVNRRKQVKINPATSSTSGTFDDKGSALIAVRGGQYGRTLTVNINGTQVANLKLPDGTNKDDVFKTDAQWIVDTLAAQISGNAAMKGWTIAKGTGFIHIVAPKNVHINSLTTADGYANQLIFPVTHYVQSFSKLPQSAPHNYIVKIVGQTGATGDQYYVTYDTNRKIWKETIGWNVVVGLNGDTMPHVLIRESDGTFTFKAHEWDAKSAGDDDTNPWPSFVSNTINDVFFFRNRLGFLSGENIILSRTSKYFNFFPASVAVLSDDDPIDVAVSFNRVSILKYAVPFTEELLLWSDEAQFVLTAGGGVLSSKTVELNLTTQFDVHDGARPFGIGRNIYFASPRATFTSINKFYSVQDVSDVKNAEDITAHVPNYIPNGVHSITGSATENFASILTTGAPNKIFMYKFLYVDDQVKQQSWSHWDLGKNIEVLACNSIGSSMYVIMRNALSTFMCIVSFTKDTIDIVGEPYRLYMDAKVKYEIPQNAYNDDTYETSINLKTVYGGVRFEHGKVSVVETDGRITEFPEPEGGWDKNPIIKLHGDRKGATVFVGFNIPFRYEFSKFLIKKTAEDGSVATEDIGRLQLRRAWVNYEHSGAFLIEVENQSRVFRYDMAGARLGSEALRVGRLNVGTGQYKFPINGDATRNTVRILADNTTPLNIIGCGWEGNYIRRSSGI